MTLEITSIIGNGWSGIIYDNGNKIVFGAYVNAKGLLITPTLYYHVKKHNSELKFVRDFIIKNKPNDFSSYFAKSIYNTEIWKYTYEKS